jgi:Rrf2 family protein
MLSQTVEYALRAMVYLAMESPATRTTEEIADATKVPRAYLAKILQGLNRASLIQTQRGIGGGISLTKTPAELTILGVINAVDPIRRITTCPLGISAHGTRLCPLHSRLDRAMAGVELSFGTTTLADLLNEEASSRPLCDPATAPQAKPTPA